MQEKNYLNWLVPIEIAKKLKKIGFNEPCLLENVETHSEDYSFINFEEEMCSDVSVMLEDVIFVRNQFLEDNIGIYKDLILKTAIPTWEQIFEWFRSKNILGWVECQCNPEIEFYTRILVNGENFFFKGKRKPYKSYEECREALIEELLIVYNKFYGNK
nr:MAG TPA: hypothetical protein [Caudoviricetes sp.]